MADIPADSIGDDEITITICEPNIPTFEFVDLPGIRAYPQAVAELTENLVRKYLANKDSLILCVVPATAPRLTSDRSFGLVQEYKKESQTIVALTRTDLIHPPDFGRLVVDRVLKRTTEFDNIALAGCIAIVNRAHNGPYTLAEFDAMEIAWFRDNVEAQLATCPESEAKAAAARMTLSRLVERLDRLYGDYICKEWKHRALEQLATMSAVAADVLTELGPDV
ncbi:unnamed protein product, partial [Phaeothamnion confervicola]